MRFLAVFCLGRRERNGDLSAVANQDGGRRSIGVDRIKSGAAFAWKGLGGLAGAGDIERDFAGAGSRILHASRDLAGCRILTFDRRRKFDHRPERKRILQIRIAGIKRA